MLEEYYMKGEQSVYWLFTEAGLVCFLGFVVALLEVLLLTLAESLFALIQLISQRNLQNYIITSPY